MKQEKNERFIVFLASVASIGLIVENIVMGWEFWVPVVAVLGIASLWVVHLSGQIGYAVRKHYYFFFAVLMLFYYGIHDTIFFDAAIAIVLVMVAYSLFDYIYMMNVLLFEYFAIVIIRLLDFSGEGAFVLDKLSVSRLVFQMVIVLLVYFISTRSINDRIEAMERDEKKDELIEAYDVDMEDFLSNISHELRTPVNVVNGMSELLIKKGAGEEAGAVKKAGIRLAYQIEDIQDYTECKRDKVILEEEDYMSTSLINDVINGFHLADDHGRLELIVDLDPKVPAMMRGDIKKLHKIFRHLLNNAMKFTKQGGIYVRMYTENTDQGMNLCIEVTDTGIGMDVKALESVSRGMYQADKGRDRSTGGIGLGLFIVYGFVHRMGGFVKIESEKGQGTTIRVTLPQKVADAKPCLKLSPSFRGTILFHVRPAKYKVPQLREFYRNMASNLALGMHVPLYATETVQDVERMREKMDVTFIFMGEDEYTEDKDYFERLSKEGVVVVASVGTGFKPAEDSRVMFMPKPLYAYSVMKIVNGERDAEKIMPDADGKKPEFKGVRALIVDDEPMNLIVAEGIFREYGMIIDTAGSGQEAVRKFRNNDYDVVFMDHMMPEMDGVEAMKQIRHEAADLGRNVIMIALTANAVSGAREMFMKEGFDGFIAKPINTADFERVMLHELPESMTGRRVRV